MVARITMGKNIRGVLNYNEHKVKEGVAECIRAENFYGDGNELNFYEKLNRLTTALEKNSVARTNAMHVSLNFDMKEKLDKDQLSEIALVYMDKIGFADQPYLVYQHTDAAHPHIHIVTTNIRDDGSRINTHNIAKLKSEPARKEIETMYGLVKAEGRKKNESPYINPIDVRRAIYGLSETRRSISNIVGMVTRSYYYTSLPELNAVLRQYNVVADIGREGSRMRANKGILYSLLDKNGSKIGIPIKASSIYGKPTYKNLEPKFKTGELLRRKHKDRIKQCIDTGFWRQGFTSGASLSEYLKNEGIYALFRQDSKGKIYGVTFVDNTTKAVFNGSDLGSEYGAKRIMERFSYTEKNTQQYRDMYSSIEEGSFETEFTGGKELAKAIDDLIRAEQLDYVSPEVAMRLKKRKGRRL